MDENRARLQRFATFEVALEAEFLLMRQPS